MKETIKIVGVLTITCAICAFFLAFIFSIAKKKIELNEKKRIEEAIVTLAPLSEKVEEVSYDGQALFKLFNDKGNLIGYAFIAEGQGYQGTIKVLGAIDPTLTRLKGIEIVESAETPGLGGKIKENFFKKQFEGLEVIYPIGYVKEEIKESNQIEAITGATVSSRAVVNILNRRVEELKKVLK